MGNRHQDELSEDKDAELSDKSRSILNVIAKSDNFAEESSDYWHKEVLAAGLTKNRLFELYKKCESDTELVRKIIHFVSVHNFDLRLVLGAKNKEDLQDLIHNEQQNWIKIGRNCGIPEYFYYEGDTPSKAVSLMATMLPDGYCLQVKDFAEDHFPQEGDSMIKISTLKGENKGEIEYSTVYISRYSDRVIPRVDH